jgi:hypothetical protein
MMDTTPPEPANPYIAGASAEQLQRPGIGRRLLESLGLGAVANGPRATSTADLPPAQIIPARPTLEGADVVVPDSTGAPMLPGRYGYGLGIDGLDPQTYEEL